MKYHDKVIIFVIFVIFLNAKNTLFAQDYGFKIGTNWTTFLGQKEKDAADTD